MINESRPVVSEDIEALLRQVAGEDIRLEAPPRVEQAIMQAWDARPAFTPPARAAFFRPRVVWSVVAAAACLVLSVTQFRGVRTEPAIGAADTIVAADTNESTVGNGVGNGDVGDLVAGGSAGGRSGSQARGERGTTAGHGATNAIARGQAPGTVAAAGAVAAARVDMTYERLAWLDADPTSLQVVHLRVAGATLAGMGVPFSDLDGDGTVDIEVIVGPDGVARSVREAAIEQ